MSHNLGCKLLLYTNKKKIVLITNIQIPATVRITATVVCIFNFRLGCLFFNAYFLTGICFSSSARWTRHHNRRHCFSGGFAMIFFFLFEVTRSIRLLLQSAEFFGGNTHFTLWTVIIEPRLQVYRLNGFWLFSKGTTLWIFSCFLPFQKKIYCKKCYLLDGQLNLQSYPFC